LHNISEDNAFVIVSQWINYVSKRLKSAELFYGHGTDNPDDEAAWLVLHAVGAVPDGSFQTWDLPLNPDQETRVLNNLSARVDSGVPLAYILGSAWFAGLEFEVDSSVLVPRSPIAELILEHFDSWIKGCANETVLDMCTGSGCIGIATAVHMPQVKVDAVDISQAALAVARKNIRRHGVESRVTLYQSDLFTELAGKSYDLIVANPPYVASSALQHLPAEYRAEPELGLVSGTDGLDACLRIMLQSPDYMKVNGTLICEVGESEQRLDQLLPQVPFLWLEFSNGGSGVFVLSRQELMRSSAAVLNVVEERKNVT
jgi:ribosomal protein L3 glutamine methyltransferase